MRLRTFFAGSGDCLLLTSARDNHVLIDGGPTGPLFNKSAGDTLEEIHRSGRNLDLVVVTHIDDDHIDGILSLLDRQTAGAPVPSIGVLWHNTWPAPTPHTAAAGPGALRKTALLSGRTFLATMADSMSVQQAEELYTQALSLRRPIRRNAGFRNGSVRLTNPPHTRRIDEDLTLTVLWPDDDALRQLKTVFDKHHKRAARRRKRRPPLAAANTERQDLQHDVDTLLRIGNKEGVTKANRASIVLLAEEKIGSESRSCLLTGDATAQDVLTGLVATKKLRTGGTFHCDVLKLQHHGAKDNFTTEFAQAIVADHYVVSANGQHTNPEPAVLIHLIEQRAQASAGGGFTLWITCDPERSPAGSRPAMQDAVSAAVGAARRVNSAADERVIVNVLRDGQGFMDICLCPTASKSRCRCTPPAATVQTLVG